MSGDFMDNRMVILVDSFDGYSDIWPAFFKIFEHYWSDCPYKIYLVSNDKEFAGVDTIKTGKEISWTDRTLKAVEQIEEKYILLLLEDYLLGDKINSEEVFECLDFMEKNDVKYLRLTDIPASRFSSDEEKIYALYQDEEYAVNLQASIWEKEFLIASLKKYKGNAWNFEVGFLSEAVHAEHLQLEGCYALKKDPLDIHNGVLKGKWFPSALHYFKRRGFEIEWQNRGKLTPIESILYNTKVFVKNHVSYNMRIKIKGMLRKLGMKFVSDL